MLQSVLLVVHLIVSMGIIALVLIQPSEAGGFLGSGGSMSNMMAPRRSADVLTRVTAWLAATFFVTSLLLAVVASHKTEKHSILDAAGSGAVKTAPAKTDAPKASDMPKASDTPPAAANQNETKSDDAKKDAAPAKSSVKKKSAPEAPVSR
jgi:preprotein translocase subunit SecG